MKIVIVGSMAFAEKMFEIKNKLENLGHQVFVSDFIKKYLNKSEEEIKKIDQDDKLENDAIRLYFNKIKKSDAILVLNYNRKGIKNYIGGNSLMEIGFAHVLGKKIFLINPIPKIEFYQSEIEATRPVVINNDLTKII